MRDAVQLRADVYRPQAAGSFPVILGRTCYDKRTWGQWIEPERTAAEGYAVVVNDTRGSFAAGGDFAPYFYDEADGYDVVEWCAEQPWSNGRVGMYGSSAPGFVQLLAALAQPPHLVAIAPFQTWSSFGRGCIYDPGGGFTMHTREWVLSQAVADPAKHLDAALAGYEQRLAAAQDGLQNPAKWSMHLPVRDFPPLPESVGTNANLYRWIDHPDDDDYWAPLNLEARYEQITIPALHLVGWYDRFCYGTVRNYLGITNRGGTQHARDNQRLIVGPWTHGVPMVDSAGDESPGRSGYVDARRALLDWYDYWLKGVGDEPAPRARASFFVQGVAAWQDESAWPPADIELTELFLHSSGRAAESQEDGRLTSTPPAADELGDQYEHDPRDPAPSTPGTATRPRGPVDHREIEQRSDVLVYTTDELASALCVAGSVRARLWAATSARDTDWFVRLIDVRPDGYARRVSEGMVRARYRSSQRTPTLLTPGEVTEYDIELLPTYMQFAAGHRLRIEVCSAGFPSIDRNPNTGAVFGRDTALETATQTVVHDAAHPSRIVVPVQSRPPARRAEYHLA